MRESAIAGFISVRVVALWIRWHQHARTDLPDLARLYADLLQPLVDERRLRPIAERGIHDLISETATRKIGASVAAAATPQAVHVQDLAAPR